jgi:hypothetical protein
MGGLLHLIPNRLHTRKELIDWLSGCLFHVDKKAPKLILVREAGSSIVTTQEIQNILNIIIATKLFMNRSYSRIAEPSDDSVIFAISVFKTIGKFHIVFILSTNRRFDFTHNITP